MSENKNEQDCEVWTFFRGGYKIVAVIMRNETGGLEYHNFRFPSSREVNGTLDSTRASLVSHGYERVKVGQFQISEI